MTFHFEIYREQRSAPLITAELVYVNADPARRKRRRCPTMCAERVLRAL